MNQRFAVVSAAKVLFAVKQFAGLERGAKAVSQATEGIPRGIVARCDTGVQVMHNVLMALKQRVQHATGKTLTAGFAVDRNLPDEQRVGLVRQAIAGDKADHLAVLFCHDGSVGKVRTLQQVAVH